MAAAEPLPPKATEDNYLVQRGQLDCPSQEHANMELDGARVMSHFAWYVSIIPPRHLLEPEILAKAGEGDAEAAKLFDEHR